MAALLHTQPAQRLGLVQLGHLREDRKDTQGREPEPLSRNVSTCFYKITIWKDHHVDPFGNTMICSWSVWQRFPPKNSFSTPLTCTKHNPEISQAPVLGRHRIGEDSLKPWRTNTNDLAHSMTLWKRYVGPRMRCLLTLLFEFASFGHTPPHADRSIECGSAATKVWQG